MGAGAHLYFQLVIEVSLHQVLVVDRLDLFLVQASDIFGDGHRKVMTRGEEFDCGHVFGDRGQQGPVHSLELVGCALDRRELIFGDLYHAIFTGDSIQDPFDLCGGVGKRLGLDRALLALSGLVVADAVIILTGDLAHLDRGLVALVCYFLRFSAFSGASWSG